MTCKALVASCGQVVSRESEMSKRLEVQSSSKAVSSLHPGAFWHTAPPLQPHYHGCCRYSLEHRYVWQHDTILDTPICNTLSFHCPSMCSRLPRLSAVVQVEGNADFSIQAYMSGTLPSFMSLTYPVRHSVGHDSNVQRCFHRQNLGTEQPPQCGRHVLSPPHWKPLDGLESSEVTACATVSWLIGLGTGLCL